VPIIPACSFRTPCLVPARDAHRKTNCGVPNSSPGGVTSNW